MRIEQLSDLVESDKADGVVLAWKLTNVMDSEGGDWFCRENLINVSV